MNTNFSQKLFIDNNIKRFVINFNKTIRDAIPLFGTNFGLPLIVTNDNEEFVGTLSNGDIRIFITNSTKIKNTLDWAPTLNTKEIVNDTFRWIIDNKKVLESILK